MTIFKLWSGVGPKNHWSLDLDKKDLIIEIKMIMIRTKKISITTSLIWYIWSKAKIYASRSKKVKFCILNQEKKSDQKLNIQLSRSYAYRWTRGPGSDNLLQSTHFKFSANSDSRRFGFMRLKIVPLFLVFRGELRIRMRWNSMVQLYLFRKINNNYFSKLIRIRSDPSREVSTEGAFGRKDFFGANFTSVNLIISLVGFCFLPRFILSRSYLQVLA